jgi:hypothetical protein
LSVGARFLLGEMVLSDEWMEEILGIDWIKGEEFNIC